MNEIRGGGTCQIFEIIRYYAWKGRIRFTTNVDQSNKTFVSGFEDSAGSSRSEDGIMLVMDSVFSQASCAGSRI